MIESVHLSSSTLPLHVAALGLLWGIMTAVTYGMCYWCLSTPPSLQKILQWSLMILGVALLAVVSLVTFPDGLRVVITHVLLPTFLCAVTLYIFFRSLHRYLTFTGVFAQVSYFKFVMSAGVLYTILFLGMVIFLRFQSYILAQLFTISVHYVMYSMMVVSMLFEIKTGSGIQQSSSLSDENDDMLQF
jgi:signal transduction histidine kinase